MRNNQMKLAFSGRIPAPSKAVLLLLAAAISGPLRPEVSAFAPAMLFNDRRTSGLKGQEILALDASFATAENVVPVSKAATTNGNKRRKQRPSKKVKARVIVRNVKKSSKRTNKINEKSRNKIKSFRALKDLKLGSKVSGTVVDVCDFGAFVNIGYATRGNRAGAALLHISQISNERITNIRKVVRPGDLIEDARVISVDPKKGEVGLSLRARRLPRRDVATLKVGEVLDGRVESVVPYGAFVDVGASSNALLHVSRITGGAIENVRHHLNEGDAVAVHVIDVDSNRKTVAVSMLDEKADRYLDRRMSQRLKRFYGTAAAKDIKKEEEKSELDYFDQAIRELEQALSTKEE